MEPTISDQQPTQPQNRSPRSLPQLDMSDSTLQMSPSVVPFTGVSPATGQARSFEVQRVSSHESATAYFSGTELPDTGLSPGPSGLEEQTTAAPDGENYEPDELEGLAEDRVVTQGYLLCLKNVSGMRQWKRLWVVLRGKSFTLYKNFEVPILYSLSNQRNINP